MLTKQHSITYIDKVLNKQDSKVIVKCKNASDVNSALNSLKQKLGTHFNIEKEELSLPKLKLHEIDNDMDLEELQEDIIARNFSDIDSECKILHIFDVENKPRSIILQVSAAIYSVIRNYNFIICVGHQSLRAFDDLNVQPCISCCRFGHSSKKCSNDKMCMRCAGNHTVFECAKIKGKNFQNKCANCSFYNYKFNKNLSTNHSAYDLDKCEALKNRIKKITDCTDYPIAPVINGSMVFNVKLLNKKVVNSNLNPATAAGTKR